MKKNKASTPCLGICSTTYGDNVCKGCKRFVHEVINWNKYSILEKELVNTRLEDFKLTVLRDRLSVSNSDLLASKLNEKGINFNDALDPLTWIFDLLRAAGSQPLDLEQFGITLHAPIDLEELKNQIYLEFLELSEAHYQRYFLVSDR
ncbi:MAG: hypothetical protein ABS21_03995 [SAR86 cluster bacterium BACL1 MAG-121105-bin34]|jgi:uncharacterized protein|uniref:Fe-S protein n=2 Tax=SAR86 cluster TaxID=62672 RepID=A0A0R2UCS0_9GAMM|nr:MAG: hypothetical protein ABR59_00075 [SAR86 cluster bacterium BACL1 MAG-120507-bin14]KRO40838.1 MAG: hypothetical protein ABR63_08560 [SAR86 cluster bacterium BACL1 MAG-120920-bin57]KRO94960.1 MAG: hypothetical protein ABS10_01105 [SAR86 cluster bacterium BACL1 MAG-120820-bin45]KRO97573.1 MAG: hypothetical protein ABS11_02380 [SAR86 cluster bacterium BACL1 MAG-120828-bin5]KRO99077.1 MAG: hypothetical protein ABS15_07035 [SAR86 cluster bacterium BACL1 MAG-120823-bin87]KRP00479.1 MAG: hypoth